MSHVKTNRRDLLAMLAALPAAALPARANALDSLPLAEAVLVEKSQRRLHLVRNGQRYRSYRIALGLSPAGHKEREGDFRTPEGRYLLDFRNPRSDFFLSIRVSYPNRDDLERARRNGWRAGGAIMVHGLPNVPRRPMDYYLSSDWTDGCIAVTNDEMLEIWVLTRAYTPIEIRA